MGKASCDQEKDNWRIQLDVMSMLVAQQENRKTELEADLSRHDSILTEIQADLVNAS